MRCAQGYGIEDAVEDLDDVDEVDDK